LVSRLLDLCVPRETIATQFHYVRPCEPLTEFGWRDLAPVLANNPTIIIIDGITEAMVMHSLELNDNSDVAMFLDRLPRRLVALGAAVVMLDHVVKSRESRNRYAIGGQHKLAGVDVTYGLDVVKPFGRRRRGLVRLVVHKDRPGHVRGQASGDVIAELQLESDPDGGVHLDLVGPSVGTDGEFRPTVLMERVSRHIEERPGCSTRSIREVKGNHAGKDTALAKLIAEGFIRVDHDGSAVRHYSVKAFRQS
jgi:hypothetical protein